ncbi:copper homeostasis protein CutC [Leifsonia sp. Root227]|uniref:copper homeostasis protein CutC n=1 Tax=Leifsonia sp. Root227 TaxID=1736496 RepID=UPI0006F6E3FB|nr:copper homeostasis protein CutC [Leifsonia sp. Root227]KRC46733.1 copper homeostasis protein CutC [Leifsonia sp. Root227]
MTLLEICLDDLDGVAAAERGGADRIELCAALSEGGITPSLGTVAAALRQVTAMGVNVLVRQRGGDFVYSEPEVAAMADDIRAIRELPNPAGVPLGFVIGALRPDNTIDVAAASRLRAACGDAPVTFHKAFDQTPDLPAALDDLIGLGIDRVLTSGGVTTAADGSEKLAELVVRSRGRVTILAGGGVRAANVAELVRRTGVTEVHLRAGEAQPSAARAAGAEPSVYDSGYRMVTSSAAVAAVVAELARVAA